MGKHIRRDEIRIIPVDPNWTYEKPKRGRKPIDDSEHVAKALAGNFRTANEAAYSIAQNAVDCVKEPREYNRLYSRLRTKLLSYY